MAIATAAAAVVALMVEVDCASTKTAPAADTEPLPLTVAVSVTEHWTGVVGDRALPADQVQRHRRAERATASAVLELALTAAAIAATVVSIEPP